MLSTNPDPITDSGIELQIALGQRLLCYHAGSDKHFIILIEGYSKPQNCLYGRVEGDVKLDSSMQEASDHNAVYLMPF